MSTIKSSTEHLTLNADGTGKEIKFQANGVEKASISSAGAFTSTTIDATKLTGNLPAINGASLTGIGDAWADAPPSGAVLRVLFDTYTTNFTTSSTAWVDTGLTVTVTPNSISSKFHLQWNQQQYIATGTSVWEGVKFRVLRNGSEVWADNYTIAHAKYQGHSMRKLGDSWLDSPATTSSIIYKIQVRPYNTQGYSFNHGSSYSQLTVMEVQG